MARPAANGCQHVSTTVAGEGSMFSNLPVSIVSNSTKTPRYDNGIEPYGIICAGCYRHPVRTEFEEVSVHTEHLTCGLFWLCAHRSGPPCQHPDRWLQHVYHRIRALQPL